MPENCIYSYKSKETSQVLLNPEAAAWASPGSKVVISRLWNGGKPDSPGNPIQAEVASLWGEESIFFYFNCTTEGLNVNPDYPKDRSVEGLWDYDVAEVFLKPSASSGYFEYEVSPLSQYLAAHIIKPWEKVNFAWKSGMKARAFHRKDHSRCLWKAVIELPYAPMTEVESFTPPQTGDIWRANLFLALGEEPSRQYLSWQPTLTEQPDFHVPDAFGNLLFKV